MTTTFIVLAHPDPHAFNGAWADATARACEALGHTVLRSDLVAMGFDPVERAAQYPHRPAETPFDALKAQEEAAERGVLPADVARKDGCDAFGRHEREGGEPAPLAHKTGCSPTWFTDNHISVTLKKVTALANPWRVAGRLMAFQHFPELE